MMADTTARGGRARALTSRSSNRLQTFAVLLACLVLYSLVTDINPGRLQSVQTYDSEGKEASLRAGAAAIVDEAKSEENSEANDPTHEPSYFRTNSPLNSIDFCAATPSFPIETEKICELLKQHMSGHWQHYFSSYDKVSTVIQNDPSIEQNAFPITDEMLNDASIRLMHFPEEMEWLHGEGQTDFSRPQCRHFPASDDAGRAISYVSSIGNQCGCGLPEFQPTFSSWSSLENASRDLSRGESKYKFMKNSPTVRLARRFASKNQTVCFVGDSVDLQLYDGLRTNLKRSDTLHQKNCGSSFVSVSSTEYPAKYSTDGSNEDRKYRKRMADGFWMLMDRVLETTVLFHDTQDGFRFRWLQHYMWAPWTYEYMNSCDVIMMDHALHYRLPLPNEELFNDVMAAIIYLANFTAANDKVAIWRSALPVHFDTPTGHYDAGLSRCVAHKDEYILQEGNELQEYTKTHKQAFAKLCQTDTTSCGQLTHTCTVDTKSTDLFTVYAYWIANNMTEELKLHEDDEPIVTGTIHNWPLFDLFNTPMWHFNAVDCTHFCYIPALYEEAFERLDLLLSEISSNPESSSSENQGTMEEVPSALPNDQDSNFATQGAHEWYKNWMFASLKGKDSVVQTDTHDDFVASQLHARTDATLKYMTEMKERYISLNALPGYRARGLGWIDDRLDMMLTLIVAGNFDQFDPNETSNITLAPGQVSVFIVDVVGNHKCKSVDSNNSNWMDQPPLTMWVRANGPEIHAGTALPYLFLAQNKPEYRHRCVWRYDFDAAVAGPYQIDAKVLLFNGFASYDNSKCKMEPFPSKGELFDKQDKQTSDEDRPIVETINFEAVQEFAATRGFAHHRGVNGHKLYGVLDGCCEACSRARGCKMWSSPGALKFDECELYFDTVEEDLDYFDLHARKYIGREPNYSYLAQQLTDYPIIQRKRRLSTRSELVNDTSVIHKQFPGGTPPQFGYSRDEATTYFIGCGWNPMLTWENPCHYPTDDLVYGSGRTIQITESSSQQMEAPVKATRQCTLDDEQLQVSNGRWVRYPFPDESVCQLREDGASEGFRNYVPEYTGDMPILCWHRDDISQLANACGEMHCSETVNHRYITSLKKETRWCGMWESYDCVYRDMTNDEIQDCISSKNISKIDVAGASISGILLKYLEQRIRNISFADNVPGSKRVVLDTLRFPHLLWNNNEETNLAQMLAMPNVTADVEHYFVTGFYYSSEREPHVQVDRSLLYSQIAYDVLTPKGYKMINGFDVTAAFTFDTAGQFDGLHIGGPPIRSIITRFFHHLCLG